MTYDVSNVYNMLQPAFKGRIRLNEPLSRHSTFGVGGPADIWLTVDKRNDLINLVEFCAEQFVPLLVVGNGTNLLYTGAGVRGIVARIALTEYTIEDNGDGTGLLVAGAGVSWPKLLNELAPQGWGGLEFGPGIPGTLGGGVISNAGAHNSDLGQVLEWIEILDARGINRAAKEGEDEIVLPTPRRYLHDELDLGYRQSRFRKDRRILFEGERIVQPPRDMIEPGEIVMQLGIRLHRDDPQKLRATVDAHKLHRKQTQPVQASAGSVFKNPPGDYSGRLIEQVGLRGYRHGKAQISERHANFIVNLGGATADDVLTLVNEAHRRVLEQFGVDLELEVELRGEWEG